MVEGYLEDAAQYIENIKNGFANDDQQAIAFNAHPLKSSSKSLGIIGLGNIATKIEHEVKDISENGGEISHLQELVPLLEEALKHAEGKLRESLSAIPD